jgi:hypothetical protein
MVKHLIRGLALAALLVASSAFAAAGLINQLSGDVTYTTSGASGSAKAWPFMKVREGDRFTLPAGAQARIVYFQGGRQEAYVGPATLIVGAQASQQQSGPAPQVSQLPAGVPQKIAQTPELVQIARLGRSGVAVRGAQPAQRLSPQAQAELRHARQTYEEMRKAAAANDIVPEQYLYAVLQDHLRYEEMKPVVAEMRKRQPSDPDVQAMVDYVKVKTEGR